MKKIIGLSVVFLLILAVAVGGTIAYFADTETSSGNSITAGTLDMSLTDSVDDGTDNETQTWVFGNTQIYPTMPARYATLSITNSGSLDGYLDLSTISLVETEGTNPESETNTAEPGDLGGLLKVHLFWDANNNGAWDSGETDIYGTNAVYATFSSIAASYNTNLSIAAGATKYLTLRITWPDSGASDNNAQGDITSFSFNVELAQVAD